MSFPRPKYRQSGPFVARVAFDCVTGHFEPGQAFDRGDLDDYTVWTLWVALQIDVDESPAATGPEQSSPATPPPTSTKPAKPPRPNARS